MAFAILDIVRLSFSRILEALFDGVEYWLAERAYRRELKLKTKRRIASTVLSNSSAGKSSSAITATTT